MKLALQQERDRQAIERAGLSAVRAITLTARVRAIHAWEISGSGQLVSKALSDTLLGNSLLGHAGMAPLLAQGKLAADLRGRYRTQLLAASAGADREGLQLSSMAARLSMVNLWRAAGAGGQKMMMLSSSALTDALAFLKARLKLTGKQLDSLEAKYRTDAIRVLDGVKLATERKLQRAILEATQRGLGVKKGSQLLRKAFDDAGMGPANPWQVEAVFRTETQKAYNAGRWNTLQEPDVAEMIKGLEYVAIHDARTTPLCDKLDGTVRPLDDPFWKKYFPPNHFNCRSSTVEVFKGDRRRMSKVPDLKGVERDPSFEVNFGAVLGDLMKRAG